MMSVTKKIIEVKAMIEDINATMHVNIKLGPKSVICPFDWTVSYKNNDTFLRNRLTTV